MGFKDRLYRDLEVLAATKRTYPDDFRAWREAITKVISEYCMTQKMAQTRLSVRNGVVVVLVFFGGLTLWWNVKIGAVGGCVAGLIAFLAHMSDARRFLPNHVLRSEEPLPDVMLGMLADDPGVPTWFKTALAYEVEENGAASWSHLAWTIDQLSGVISNAHARGLSGAQRLMKYIKPSGNEGA